MSKAGHGSDFNIRKLGRMMRCHYRREGLGDLGRWLTLYSPTYTLPYTGESDALLEYAVNKVGSDSYRCTCSSKEVSSRYLDRSIGGEQLR